ncbi:hypothetical protein BCE_4017 [Bacillus cereus ATCC 10987]|uniref:Uncharacterized protein n=1 Tax=Bacillus cereus (strain ATCC 10987 / NRS 248) TaxID=222523 RepID=Q731Z8_BACC1|nr:hypothetical protein BCE_4017 [Bacillus cereus ATCC 10987]
MKIAHLLFKEMGYFLFYNKSGLQGLYTYLSNEYIII